MLICFSEVNIRPAAFASPLNCGGCDLSRRFFLAVVSAGLGGCGGGCGGCTAASSSNARNNRDLAYNLSKWNSAFRLFTCELDKVLPRLLAIKEAASQS